jgi:PAS domain S-box-containing protein
MDDQLDRSVTTEERRESLTRLAEPEVQTGLLGHAVDSAPAALFVVDEHGRLVGANRYACAMLGYEREELLGLSVRDLEVSRDLESVLRQGGSEIASLRHSDGHALVVRCQARPTETDHLSLLAWVAQPLRGLPDEATAETPPRRGRRSRARNDLTERELEILQLMADGFENEHISRELFISRETVKTHVRRLLRKLRARSRTHAVAQGLRHNLIA